jgi:hypothetical protein
MKPKYIDWLVDGGTIITNEGKSVNLLELQIYDDEAIIEEWAKRFRENYCTDTEIDMLRAGYGFSRKEYLENIKFPDKNDRLGSATRSGDFCEILIADYVQFVLDYYIPRTRYDRKINRNSSPMGSDLFGFKVGAKVSQNDEMIIFEVKAQASETSPENKLQKAVNDSNKDIKRIAESLNAANQRLIDKERFEEAKIVQRFQNATDRPYKQRFAAAAIHSNKSFSKEVIKQVSTASHIQPNLLLLVVHSEKLMNFIHQFYGRASIC